ncbi:unnamed protein product [Paramecium sonneborni]|uniref:Uncharacterized protein n=1 Tax=Paramecium sonneborni TaxID=65129 RepID=A0A8S1QD47_9CILI|nr:unnamed protein product [Paramecium sonneborni]
MRDYNEQKFILVQKKLIFEPERQELAILNYSKVQCSIYYKYQQKRYFQTFIMHSDTYQACQRTIIRVNYFRIQQSGQCD